MAAVQNLNPTKDQLAVDSGPYLLATGMNWALLGCLSVQVYTYSISSVSDRRPLKALVYAVYLVEIIQTALATYCAWVQLIFTPYGYADTTSYSWSNISLVPFAGIVSFTAQCFFARRIWIVLTTPIMRNLVVCIVVVSLANAHYCFGRYFY
ncbi:hypothetical protein PLICRDRAFT_42601 [Plicaturopsis crispa FD-325 SS-3]|nr:hypothetical protein PLICRDRAFT_42601 [Plicaturopsis crispa FD-325 SS-3]